MSDSVRTKYRADIDGLRAIAVLSVVIYHAFPVYLRGGFVGVDIFFVISGFLISTVILGEIENDRFQLREFYVRRIRRIFPALITVLVFCLTVGWFTLLSDEFSQLGIQVFGGAAFFSNFIFWYESGYFDALAETKPLLHIWSLGVEEQFYILFPLLLVISWQFGFRSWVMPFIVALLSFSLNILTVSNHPDAAFYLLHTRAWELMIGVMLAYASIGATAKPNSRLIETGRQDIAHWVNNIQPYYYSALSWLGMYLILAGFFLIDNESKFPGYLALLPCVGTALVIYAGPSAWLNRVVLSNKAVVAVGLISYPLYLWHWPILTIPRVIEGTELQSEMKLFLLAVSLVLAWATYQYIEKPIRFGENARKKAILLMLAMSTIGIVGLLVFLGSGLPNRGVAKSFAAIDGDVGVQFTREYMKSNFYDCKPLSLYQSASPLRCRQSKKLGPARVAIVGDSHAEHLFIGLAEAFPEQNMIYFMHYGLPVERNKNFSGILDHILKSEEIDFVVLTAAWGLEKDISLEGLASIVEKIAGTSKHVFLTDDVPSFRHDAEACKYTRRFRQHVRCTERKERSVHFRRYEQFNPWLEEIAASSEYVSLLKTTEYLCGDKTCSMKREGVLLYRDNDHLNLNGSKYVGDRIRKEYPSLFSK